MYPECFLSGIPSVYVTGGRISTSEDPGFSRYQFPPDEFDRLDFSESCLYKYYISCKTKSSFVYLSKQKVDLHYICYVKLLNFYHFFVNMIV